MDPAGKCVIVSAPSGAGKTTIVRRLVAGCPSLEFSVSATSRTRRADEIDGRDYWFITTEEFQERIKADAFVEWQEVYEGQYYGTLRSELAAIHGRGHHPAFDVDVEGGLRLKGIFADRALALFIAPPSMEALETRLRSRGTETADSLRKRVAKAEHEIAFAPRFDHVVVNDDLHRACSEAEGLVRDFLTT